LPRPSTAVPLLTTATRLNELLHLEAMTRPSRIVMANATKPKSA
jgi:hypothetical protein